MNIVNFRRILHDDGRGVGEPLDEVVCVDNKCDGLTVYIHSHYCIRFYFLQHRPNIIFIISIMTLPHTNSYRLRVLIMSMSTSLDMEPTGDEKLDKKFIHPFFLVSLMRYVCILSQAVF